MVEWNKTEILNRIRPEELYDAFLGLERNARIGAVVGGTLILVFLLWWPADWLLARWDAKHAEYEEYRAKASEFLDLATQYSDLKKNFQGLENGYTNLGTDPLRTVILQQAEAVGVQVVIKSVSLPQKDGVQEVAKSVSLSKVPLDLLLKFIDKISHSQPPLSIKKLNMRVDPKNKTVLQDVDMTVSTIKPADAAP